MYLEAATRWPRRLARHLLLVAIISFLSNGRHHDRYIFKSALADNQIMLTQSNLVDVPIYQQHNNILRFEVLENAPNNTHVGRIRSSDNEIPQFIIPLSTPDPPEKEIHEAFTFNLQTGDIYAKIPLDRERREYYHFVALIQSPFKEIKCSIRVLDVNDNAPMFSMAKQNETNFVIEMPEGQRGIRKSLPIAIDLDSPQFGIKEFRITSGNMANGMFQLVEHEAPARSTLQGSLAADDATNSAPMTAGENPQLLQQLAQQATVLIPSQPDQQSASINSQNSPAMGVFMSPSLPATASSSISQFGANAKQQPLPQIVTSATGFQSKYSIDLEVIQPLDRENQSTYHLVVEAIDGGATPLIGRLMVTVNVQDVNDNDPVFRENRYERHFREDTAKGTLLLRVQANDADSDANGQISYYIKRHSSSSQTYPINSNSSDNNELSTNRFNNKQRLQPQTMALTATSSSTGKLAQRSSQVNLGSNEIYDNQDTTASDSIDHKPPKPSQLEPLFEIDSFNGDIKLLHSLDYETDQSHELVIEARDHGKPPRSAFTTVKVFVTDVDDDPPPNAANNRLQDERRQSPQVRKHPGSEVTGQLSSDTLEFPYNYLQNFNFANMNSSLLFVLVLMALLAMAFPLCLVKIKSNSQTDLDYNDTDGLNPNSIKTKQSPNHSTSNEHPMGSNDGGLHRHLDHQRRANGSFGGVNGTGSSFESPNGKMRYHYVEQSNFYHNPSLTYPQQQIRHQSGHLSQPDSPTDHQMAGGLGSAGGTLTLHSHHPLLSAAAGHHQFGNSGQGHHTSSLTYAHHHSRAALHQAHHHQSSHHLSSVHHHGHHNKGGTMNSVGTHHSAHPSASPLPATPNTTHSSGAPPNHMLDSHHVHHSHHQNTLLPLPSLHSNSPLASQPQLPPTPCNAPASLFWPQGPGSTVGCLSGSNGQLHCNASSTTDCAQANTLQPLDRWSDLGVPSQLVYAQDLYGSYNSDYLSDWAPDYNNLMQLIEADASGH